MRAKKSFGQHFLTNEDIARRIAGSLLILENGNMDSGDRPRVLEVGPGKGMLTKYLLEKNIDLKVVEADNDMVAYLEDNYPELYGRIIAQDFLKLDLNTVFPQSSVHSLQSTVFSPQSSVHSPQSTVFSPQSSVHSQSFLLIGNFPYNISSQIVFRMVEYRRLIPEMAGMFQKEMAQRIIAPPGGKDYGVISVLTQAFYEGKYLFSVSNRNFHPPPKVQSGVIRLTRKEGELGCNEDLFRKVVKQAFSQRRKMLRNTMKPFFNDPAILEEDFFKQRPEVLSVAEFVALTRRVANV